MNKVRSDLDERKGRKEREMTMKIMMMVLRCAAVHFVSWTERGMRCRFSACDLDRRWQPPILVRRGAGI